MMHSLWVMLTKSSAKNLALLDQSFLVGKQELILGTDDPVTDSVYKMLLQLGLMEIRLFWLGIRI